MLLQVRVCAFPGSSFGLNNVAISPDLDPDFDISMQFSPVCFTTMLEVFATRADLTCLTMSRVPLSAAAAPLLGTGGTIRGHH